MIKGPLVCGVDEAGRGALAGPVVAGAVVLGDYDFGELLRDSKVLTSSQRERAYQVILSRARTVGVGVVTHRSVDKINVLQASMLAMQRAVSALHICPSGILVDGNRVPSISLDVPIQSIIGGDRLEPSISAASIVAKVTRDHLMRRVDFYFPEYGFASHKGYGTALHYDRLLQYGISPIHRRSFNLSVQKKLFV